MGQAQAAFAAEHVAKGHSVRRGQKTAAKGLDQPVKRVVAKTAANAVAGNGFSHGDESAPENRNEGRNERDTQRGSDLQGHGLIRNLKRAVVYVEDEAFWAEEYKD